MKKWVFILLIVICSAVFIISLVYLLDYMKASGENTVLYEDLADIVAQARPDAPQEQTKDDATGSTEETGPVYEYVTITDPQTGEELEVLPEYAAIYELNNDLVGWICIEGTDINYPVMQTPDRTDYYLTRNFERNYSNHGAIYVREQCDVFVPSDNVVIYGHKMNDGSMFSPLHKYKKKDFYDQHQYIIFDTLKERHTYQIISVFSIASERKSPFQYHLYRDFEHQDQFDTFITHCREYQYYDTGVQAQWGDKLITLSTCDRTITNGRLVVVAKRID